MIYKYYKKIKRNDKLKVFFLNFEKKKKKIISFKGIVKNKKRKKKEYFFCLKIKLGKYKIYKNFSSLSSYFLYYNII
ncbi:hypothetical protein [Candidatus Vidania fulgoroideorum]